MKYIIYKITNVLDGKIYIGAHRTLNEFDSYMGSGTHLKLAQKKYGIENFTKEILFIFSTLDEMNDMESMLVNESFVSDDMTYNLCIGGRTYIPTKKADRLPHRGLYMSGTEFHQECIIKAQKALVEARKCPYWDAVRSANMSASHRVRYANGGKGSFTGKKHSHESKAKIGRANSVKQSGECNSSFGTMWIYSEEERISKKILKTEDIPDGWNKGRVLDFDAYFIKKNKPKTPHSPSKALLTVETIKRYREAILASNPSEYGWISRAQKKLNLTHSTIRKFANKYCTDLLFFKRRPRQIK